MKLSKRQKQFLYALLNKSYMPSACDVNISVYYEPYNPEGDPKTKAEKLEPWQDFKKHHGITINTANKWWDHFIKELEKDINK